jgi:hypothetical protein
MFTAAKPNTEGCKFKHDREAVNSCHMMSDNTGQGLTLAWGYTISSSHGKVNPNASTEEGEM